eukprot:COSAG05_NODE_7881_length_760_cov_0.627837_2_plen_32_part_01
MEGLLLPRTPRLLPALAPNGGQQLAHLVELEL